jgi:DHA1 family inner membrane transport protein
LAEDGALGYFAGSRASAAWEGFGGFPQVCHDDPMSQPESTLHRRDPLAATAALLALSAAAFSYVTTESLPVGLLQPISRSLQVSLPTTGLLVTVYAAINVTLSAPLATLTKDLPRKTLICSLMGALVLTSLAAAGAPGYGWLMAVRVVTALGQAVFWSVVIPTAASLFPAGMTGRAVGWVLGGASLAVVLGVPAATWLGQVAGWRAAFAGIAVLAGVVLLPVAFLLPAYHPSLTHAGTGSAPDRRRYRVALATTVLAVGGFFSAYTYVSPFLTRVAGLALHRVPEVLLLTGAATAGGVVAGSWLSRHRPATAPLVPVLVMAPALLALWSAGHSSLAAVALMAVACVCLGAYDVSNQNRVMEVAPGSTDIASAWVSAAFNAGIAGGSLAGGLVLRAFGARSTALLGGLVAVSALVAAVLATSLGPVMKPKGSA